MNAFNLLLCASLLLSGCAANPDFENVDMAITNVHVIDAETGAVVHDQTIVIDEGRILAIMDDLERALTGVSSEIDSGGAYAIPGLWESHAHVLADPDDAIDRILPAYLGYGVTHVRDMGSRLDHLQTARSRLAQERPAAARLIGAGPLLVEQELRWYGDIQQPIGEPGAADQAVTELAAGGVDFLKAYSGLSPESYESLMAAAAREGVPVDGHVPERVGLVGVVDAGQRTIEHLDMSAFVTCGSVNEGAFEGYMAVRFGQGMEAFLEFAERFWSGIDFSECGPALAQMSARGGALTPTLVMQVRDRSRVPDRMLQAVSPSAREWCQQGLAELDGVPVQTREAYYSAVHAALLELHARDVRLLAGSDTPNHCIAPAVSLSLELERLAEAGLPLLAVLQSATVNPREVFGGQGAGLAPGLTADFVLLPANPLDDVGAYTEPVGVFSQGRWHSREALADLRARLALSQ